MRLCGSFSHCWEMTKRRTRLLNELQTFSAYQDAVVDMEMYSYSLAGKRELKRSEMFNMSRKDRHRSDAHDRCILACRNINDMCEKHGVPAICDFDTDDRHKVARFTGEMVRAWYIEAILPGLRTLSENVLNESEIAEVVMAAESLEIPAECLVFNDEKSLMGVEGTCYHREDDKIYVTRDVFPDQHKNSTHPRDILTVSSVLAIEYYGRRKYLKKNPSVVCDWRSEVDWVVDTARFAPCLTKLERALVYHYAAVIAEEHGYIIMRDEHMNSIDFGDGTVETKDIPIKYSKEQEIYGMVEEAQEDIYGYKSADDDTVLETAEKMMNEFDEAFKELAK